MISDVTVAPPMMIEGRSGLRGVPGATQPDTDPQRERERLRAACRDFESVFLRILLREMRKTVPEGGVFALSSAAGMYRDIADDFFAVKLAESGGMGLGDVLYRELARALAAQTYGAAEGDGGSGAVRTGGGT